MGNILNVIIQKINELVQSSPQVVAIYISIFTLILGIATGIVKPFIGYIINCFFYKEKVDARRKIRIWNKNLYDVFKNEQVFFDDKFKKLIFLTSPPIMNLKNNKKTLFLKLCVKSYLLTGEAGAGKSSILKMDFLLHRNLQFVLGKSIGYIFLDGEKIRSYICDKDLFKSDLTTIENAKYRKIILFIDGVDEIGVSNVENFKTLIESLAQCSKINKIKISCRTNFARKYLKPEGILSKIKTEYNIHQWNSKKLIKLSKKILKKRFDNQKHDELLNEIKKHVKLWSSAIDSPLLMKMYIYILLYGNSQATIDFNNKYELYCSFVSQVVFVYSHQTSQKIPTQQYINEQLEKMASIVFDAHQQNTKHILYDECFAPILKSPQNPETTFVHETFFEFFVAYNYSHQIEQENVNYKTLLTLSQNYTNNFADFISDALKTQTCEDKVKIIDKLCEIYYYTFSISVQKEFRKIHPQLVLIDKSDLYLTHLKKLNDNEFFSLKYEILFRLGRLGISNNKIASFLNFVYNNDENTKHSGTYFTIVLKRCCAISSSFIENEEIEIDYIRKMLPFFESYIEDYDLVNRSHTLVFYGDVLYNNIYDFKDINPAISYKKAFNKRLHRLSTDLPNQINLMDSAEKKKYLFRLFDLATIYTFIKNRRIPLTDDDFKIIKDCCVNFTGSSVERTELMNKIKLKIIELQGELLQ